MELVELAFVVLVAWVDSKPSNHLRNRNIAPGGAVGLVDRCV
jgi:hypothetical protein